MITSKAGAGVEYQTPFGGMKESSSYSLEQGKAAIGFFPQVKTVYVDPMKGQLNE